MKLVTWVIAFILAPAFNTSTGALSQSQSELNQAACESYKKADAQLNRIYNQILNDYAGDKNFVEKMRVAERAWIAFRDAHVNSIYPDPDTRRAYGSIHPMCYCALLEQLTNDRIKTLRMWTDGVPEGDGCTGSQKVR